LEGIVVLPMDFYLARFGSFVWQRRLAVTVLRAKRNFAIPGLQFRFGLGRNMTHLSRGCYTPEPGDDLEDRMMPSSTAIERLAKLLSDEARIEDKIRDAKAALSLIQKRVSEALAQHYMAMKEPRIQIPEELMREEESFERLLQALQDMKNEIAKQIRPVEEQIIQANVDHLRQIFDQESRRLTKCLEEIDDNILACRQYLQDYEHVRSSLHGVNEKLSQLGAESLPLPDGLPTLELGEIVRERIEHLRSQGKI
jgi:DNA repair exonuclease SbcCD ATPase subunit